MPARLIDSLGTTDELADLFDDRSVLRALLSFESALARAQARLGIIPQSAAGAISKVTSTDDTGIAREARKHGTLGVPFVKWLVAQVGAIDEHAARFVHFGATSQDLTDTALILLLRDAQAILARDNARLAQSLRALSERHATSVMLARTVLQPALPITFGYKVAGWYGAVQRSWKRLHNSFTEALQLQFGGAAGTLASYGNQGIALTQALAEELLLAAPRTPWQSHRDRVAAVVTNCAIYVGALAKIARDISLLMQYEISEVAESGGGSSAMPHKRNPAGCVVALSAATRMPSLAAAYLNGMVQEHERAAGGWQAEWQTVSQVVETTGSALAAMVDVVAGLTVDAARMRANLEATHGMIFAEKASMDLTAKVGREAAHAALSKAIQSEESLHVEGIERPEDYLGMAEEFRRRLLEE